jgi:DNA-binding transcriptional LysR family regulator
VALVDQLRQARLEPKRVHTISSVSAMVQLVQGGFGVATLPRNAVARLAAFPNIKVLACDTLLQPLPIHASYRTDPSSLAVETVVRSAFEFIDLPTMGRTKAARKRAPPSKKSMS